MNNTKNIIKILSVSALFFSFSIFSMLPSSIGNLIEQRRHHQALKKKLNEIKNFTKIEEVDKEIDTLKKNVFQELITNLANITQIPHEKLEKRITTERKNAQFFLSIPLLTCKHDNNIPLELYNSLTKNLSKEGIDPSNLTLIYKTDDQKYAETSSGQFLTEPIILPHMYLYPLLLKKSKQFQKFTFFHEISHVKLQHSSIVDLVNNNPSIISIIEQEANLDAASKNIKVALAGKNYQCNENGHPQILNQQSHCKDMTLMYALMERKQELS